MRRSKTIGYAELGKALREQIVLEGRDKLLLLKWLQGLSDRSMPPHGGVPGGGNVSD